MPQDVLDELRGKIFNLLNEAINKVSETQPRQTAERLVQQLKVIKIAFIKFNTHVEENKQRSAEHNIKLEQKLLEMKTAVEKLIDKVEKLTAPPSAYAVFVSLNSDGTANVNTGGREMKVNVSPDLAAEDLKPGKKVALNDNLNIVEIGEYDTTGEVATVKEVLDDCRVIVTARLDEEKVVNIAEKLKNKELNAGDRVVLSRADWLTEVLPKEDVGEYLLEEVQNISYEHIGGLKEQIAKIQDIFEFPFTPAGKELYRKMKLEIPKGMLLYGPPGCGKTLIAKAVARSVQERMAKQLKKEIKGYFVNIKGPELYNKYVGETERKIREIFQHARKKASADCPVTIFIDEADSLLRTRGSGISSDVEITVVPQFLVEVDGLESSENIIVILASNRQDLIDPAVLRPGRVDIKIKIERPDKEGAKEIFAIYLAPELPLNLKYADQKHPAFKDSYKKFSGDPKAITDYIINESVKRLYATDEEPYRYKNGGGKETAADNRVLEATTSGGEKFILYFKDLASGAMIKSIVDRGKRNAIKRAAAGGDLGLCTLDFCSAIEAEMAENEELPNTVKTVQDWLQIQGRRENIIHVRSFMDERKKQKQEKPIEPVKVGHYL